MVVGRKLKAWLGLPLIPLLLGAAPPDPRLTTLREGGEGPPTLVFLHGYGSSAEHWHPFVQALAGPPSARFIFPQAAKKMTRRDGGLGARAWWPLDFKKGARPNGAGADLALDHPKGLARSSREISAILHAERSTEDPPIILGGFSQGAMVACQIAFTTEEPLSALVILSGTGINRAAWKQRMAFRKGLRVFMAHGREDAVLPFDMAERLRDDLVAAGMAVTFVPFTGGHEMPAEVVTALREFLGWKKEAAP